MSKGVVIVPTIMAGTEGEALDQLRAVYQHTRWLQIDIMDGEFVADETWGDSSVFPHKKEEIAPDVQYEVHLMVAHPLRQARAWIGSGADRVIVHWEAVAAFKNPHEVMRTFITEATAAGVEPAVAVNPDTSLEHIDPFVSVVDMVLCMGRNPGRKSHPFREEVYGKVDALSSTHPQVAVEVDGGVNAARGQRMVTAGATHLAVHSSVFGAEDPAQAISTLQHL